MNRAPRLALTMLAVTLLASSALGAPPEDNHPLLQLVVELDGRRDKRNDIELASTAGLHYDGIRSREAERNLARANPPADDACARSMGAEHYAQLHLQAGNTQLSRGDIAAALASFRRAHACRPRSIHILSRIAYTLLESRDHEGARRAVDQALAIDSRAVTLHLLAGQLDFVAERWADAAARFRYVASSDDDRNGAARAQLLFCVAQVRAGVKEPEFVVRRWNDYWPKPLMLFLQGQLTERELADKLHEDVGEEWWNDTVDGQLVEALFYVGEVHWSKGRPDLAKRYFAALVSIRHTYQIEHGLALAEIAKLNRLTPALRGSR